MDSENSNPQPPASIVFWIIWFSILSGLFMIMFFAAGGMPSGENDRAAPLWVVLLASVGAIAAMSIRFLLIPKITEISKLLTAMIIGLAIAEGIGFLGLFIVSKDLPQTRLALFVTSVSCIITLAPIYVTALINRKEMR